MRFELDINRRDLSDETLLQDVLRVANQLQTKSPTIEQYAEHGRFNPSTIIRRFGGWQAGLLRAGLTPTYYNRPIDPHEALADLRRVADILKKKSIAASEYENHGRFSAAPFTRLFGSWNKAQIAAGLQLSKRHHIPDDELFQNLEKMWRTLGRQPNYGEVRKPFSDFSSGTYEKHFGGWRKALEAFVEFANATPSEERATDPVVQTPFVSQLGRIVSRPKNHLN